MLVAAAASPTSLETPSILSVARSNRNEAH
jgi:hypothetical protein